MMRPSALDGRHTVAEPRLLRRRLPWLVEQIEVDQLFLSWPVAPAALAERIPPPLSLDTRDGRAWVTLVAFRVERLRPRGLPPVPGLSRFAEIDYLTYVRLDDEPGVWFLRIDAATRLGAVVGRLFALPYHHAAVRVSADGDWRHVRRAAPAGGGAVGPELHVRYRPIGPEHEVRAGTLAHFLLERFVMFSRAARGTLLRGVQARAPRRLRACEVVLDRSALPGASGVPAPYGELQTWQCASVAVRTWLPAPVRQGMPDVRAPSLDVSEPSRAVSGTRSGSSSAEALGLD
jgi:uncharacterized protein YqjF (DUF2071 family)